MVDTLVWPIQPTEINLWSLLNITGNASHKLLATYPAVRFETTNSPFVKYPF
jgi:hypothetical protein